MRRVSYRRSKVRSILPSTRGHWCRMYLNCLLTISGAFKFHGSGWLCPIRKKKLILHLLSSINPIKSIPSVGHWHLRLSWIIINVAWEQSITCNVVKPVQCIQAAFKVAFLLTSGASARQLIDFARFSSNLLCDNIMTASFSMQGTILDPDLFPIGNGIWCQWDHP